MNWQKITLSFALSFLAFSFLLWAPKAVAKAPGHYLWKGLCRVDLIDHHEDLIFPFVQEYSQWLPFGTPGPSNEVALNCLKKALGRCEEARESGHFNHYIGPLECVPESHWPKKRVWKLAVPERHSQSLQDSENSFWSFTHELTCRTEKGEFDLSLLLVNISTGFKCKDEFGETYIASGGGAALILGGQERKLSTLRILNLNPLGDIEGVYFLTGLTSTHGQVPYFAQVGFSEGGLKWVLMTGEGQVDGIFIPPLGVEARVLYLSKI